MTPPNALPEPQPGARRTTPLASRGEPMVWLTGGTLAICLVMVITLLGVVLYEGSRTFLVRPIDLVTLQDGRRFLGVPMREEAFDPPAAERDAFEARRAAGNAPAGAFAADGRPVRRLYIVGNREVRDQPNLWVPLVDIAGIERPRDAVLVERLDGGVWLGTPTALVRQRVLDVSGPAEAVPAETRRTVDGVERTVRSTVLGPGAEGKVRVRERIVLAEGGAEVIEAFERMHGAAMARQGEIDRLNTNSVGRVNQAMERQRLRVAEAELQLRRAVERPRTPVPIAAWSVGLVAGLGLLIIAVRRSGSTQIAEGMLAEPRPGRATVTAALWVASLGLLLAAWLENPWSAPTMTAQQVASIRAEADAARVQLNQEFQDIKDAVARIDADDAAERIIITEPSTGRFAPTRLTEPDEPIRLSRIVRIVPANDLSALGRAGVYLARWGEFLFSNPRESNTAGGVYPVIFGTVLLTLLLSIAVVPLGVIAALYLREYARQGPVTSAVRIAVNNLAGVPSIVYGVFGLGFFCYTVGGFVDRGPSESLRAGFGSWWFGVFLLGAIALGAAGIGFFSRPLPGVHPTRRQRWGAASAGAMWVAAVAGAVWLITTTPYFNGFFAAKGTTSTFGTKGLLWSALTLALLTLPVVIVATEEAIASVPRSMREGSYGCGATKWQTIRRIVLPRAMPGIMTGMVLAMARGAGEVAPLMLVGVVKKADELPISGEFPFLHLQQSFMHLGFHIYDVGFQSPDSEAARPLVWCTTLLLICIVVMLNAAAIRIRASLRRKFFGETF